MIHAGAYHDLWEGYSLKLTRRELLLIDSAVELYVLTIDRKVYFH